MFKLVFIFNILISCNFKEDTHSFKILNQHILMGENINEFKKRNPKLNYFDNGGFDENYSFFTKNYSSNGKSNSSTFYAFYRNELVFFRASIDSIDIKELEYILNDNHLKMEHFTIDNTIINRKNNIEQFISINKKSNNIYDLQLYLINEKNKIELLGN